MGRLAPDRHPQGDFFIPDIFDSLNFKDDAASMEHPFFSLASRPDMRTLNYVHGDATIEIQPSSIGLPTIKDKDVLLYCGSLMMTAINKGEIPPKKMKISVHDLLKATNRHTNRQGYESIKRAFNRLTGSLIKTNIRTNGKKVEDYFHVLERATFKESERYKGRLVQLEVTLSDWFYSSLIAKEVLTINADYFYLDRSTDRRIYEIARKHCGTQKKPWSISLEKLHKKTGTTSVLKRFRHTIRELVKEQQDKGKEILPDYLISHHSEKDVVTFRYLGRTKKHDEQGDLFGDTPPTIPTQIPPDLLDDVRKVVGMGPDYYELWQEFINWKGAKKAKNLRGGFIGFCKQKAAKMVKYG